MELDKSKMMIIDRWIINTKPKVASIQVENYGLNPEGTKPVVYKFKEFVPEEGSKTVAYDMLCYYMRRNTGLSDHPTDILETEWDTSNGEDFTICGPHYDFLIEPKNYHGVQSVQACYTQFDGDVLGSDPCVAYIYMKETDSLFLFYSTEDAVLMIDMGNHIITFSMMENHEVICSKDNIEFKRELDIRNYGKMIENEHYSVEAGDGFYCKPFIFTSEGFVFVNMDYTPIRKIEQKGNTIVVTNGIYSMQGEMKMKDKEE